MPYTMTFSDLPPEEKAAYLVRTTARRNKSGKPFKCCLMAPSHKDSNGQRIPACSGTIAKNSWYNQHGGKDDRMSCVSCTNYFHVPGKKPIMLNSSAASGRWKGKSDVKSIEERTDSSVKKLNEKLIKELEMKKKKDEAPKRGSGRPPGSGKNKTTTKREMAKPNTSAAHQQKSTNGTASLSSMQELAESMTPEQIAAFLEAAQNVKKYSIRDLEKARQEGWNEGYKQGLSESSPKEAGVVKSAVGSRK